MSSWPIGKIVPNFLALITAIFLWSFQAQAQSGLPDLSVDDLPQIDLWGQNRISDEDLDFGESISLNNGELSFLQTDVSLPGNSDLAVSFGRRIGNTGYVARGVLGSVGIGSNNHATGVAYNSWVADIPIITGVAKGGSAYNQPEDIPYQGGRRFLGWTGIYMSIPGMPVKKLSYAMSSTPAEAQGYRYATEDHWVVKRFEGTDPTFEAVSPEGVKYTFDKVINDAYNYSKGGGIIAATEISDVHGNWVKFEYSGTKVTRIYSNDGREITIAYVANNFQYGEDVVQTVTANGRTWTYSYTSGGDLYRVTLPDGRYWKFNDIGILSARIAKCNKLGVASRTLTVRHPSGMSTQYTLENIHNGRIIMEADIDTVYTYPAAFKPTTCESKKVFYTTTGGYTSEASWLSLGFVSHAVKQKVVSVPGAATCQWTYSYDEDFGAFKQALGLQLTKSRTIIRPDGNKEVYHIYRVADWREGLVEKIEKKDSSNAVLETVARTYQKGPSGLYQPVPVHPT
ncbi:hypothetical protein HY29_18265 [Hyphomonas beringensis]|uniref:Insecticide toxin TcdB middle/N-terminal domain-containing protein n=1 Tax=Hyphomonas beringensis TaxID=1280946 RepID=A0A062TVW5_9PROT|nr:hypothetical protein [Hyphomonas beringensis]KCZ52146.1 hypothetical protein HY29_18265 [Hyphomonas beringensis]